MLFNTHDRKTYLYNYHSAFVALLIWTKTILIFEYTKTFGPLIKMITVMVIDMLTFLLLWGIIVVFFLCIGVLFFIDTPEF